ncbi:MAG: hypothetical protein RLZZ226_604 [Pseudomonadota bacterium]|jgi:outer membrane PBP1 activator LpoA protein
MSQFYRFLASLPLLALTGCVSPIAQRVASDPRVVNADQLLTRGAYEPALQAYQSLAQSTGYPDYFRLKATDAALRAGQGRVAQRLAASIDPTELDAPDRDQLLLLKSRLDLSVGKAGEAMAKLAAIHPDKLDAPRRAHFHTLKASAWNQQGNLLESARESIAASRFQTRPEEILRTRTLIYDTLARLPEAVLANQQPPAPDVLGGWMALVRIVGSGSPARVAPALAEWRAQFPGHPADGAFLAGLQQTRTAGVEVTPLESRAGEVRAATPATQSPPSPPPGGFVGVLLPQSGTYAEAAAAIKAGLDAAYAADPNPAKLPLRMVDSQSGGIMSLYQQLVTAGASAVIGPLTREHVGELMQGSGLSVPVLALNQVPNARNERVYQLGLNPEQEAGQLAASAWFDGARAALLLAPSSHFGQRISASFTAWWKQVGGKLLATQVYPYHGTDYTEPVKNLLAALPPGQRDAFVYLVADARDARLLVPQILYQSSSALPIYATSQVFTGHADPVGDQDMDGVVFCDLPWLLNHDSGDPLSADRLTGVIQGTKPDYVKLIALGIDAYRVLPELDALHQDGQYRHAGMTGTLALRDGNRFERQMSCARFQNGHPEMRGVAPLMALPGTSP